MATEAVLAVGGLVTRPSRRHEHLGVAYYVEHGIASQPGTSLLQRLAKQVVKLASTQPRLTNPLLMDQCRTPPRLASMLAHPVQYGARP